MPGKPLPKKLKHDAIVEAVFELRFSTSAVPEVFFGRLADHASWKAFSQLRLPSADIPGPMRRANPALRYTPTLELQDGAAPRLLRIGPEVLSYHRKAPYAGWEAFRPELDEAVEQIFSSVKELTPQRLGFRYINALRPDLHQVAGVTNLDLSISVDSRSLTGRLNLNFTTDVSEDSSCTVRIATPDFVEGVLPDGTVAIIDVDVYTKEGRLPKDAPGVKKWIEFAHDEEKKAFFQLLRHETIKSLTEK